MKKLFVPFILTLILGIAACSTDFDVTSDWKEITIVYGLLNPKDDVQYIRIQKAFLSENTSALELAQVGDSLYHQTGVEALSASLEEIRISNGSEIVAKTIPLQRVSGNDEGIVKDEGIFATDPYFLYKTNVVLDQNRIYRLIVNTPAGNVVSSTTNMVKDFTVSRPNPDISVSFLSDYNLFWVPAENAAIYDVDVYFNYTETRNVNGQDVTEQKRIKWDALTNGQEDQLASTGGSIKVELKSDRFLNFLANNIEADADVVERVVGKLDFVIWAGSEDFLTFNQVALAQFGITSSQAQPTYTNVENGIGLFTSRYRKDINDVSLLGTTIDLIACGDVTGNLGFSRDPDNPNPNCQ
ncbi:MAG: hypothetical protein R3E32_16835 [Chitinophagales bacterium]